MTPVYKLSASSITGRTTYGSMLAGNPAYTIPTDFESIATVTVGSGGSSSVSFSSIATDWNHLQIRGIFKMSTSASARLRLNSDTGSNYAGHILYGDGSSALASATTNYAYIEWGVGSFNSTTQFTAFVFDLLDYDNTNKFKTTRTLGGTDVNGSGGGLSLSSGLWRSTNAVNNIEIYPSAGNFAQYSHFALYGIKGA